jgi:large subunit ribosomal protein L10
MSKKIKDLMMKDISRRFDEVEAVVAVNPRGIDAVKNNQIRRRLREKNVHMTVVRNTLAKRVLNDGALKGFDSLLDGPTALVYGEVSISMIARMLIDEKKDTDKLELRGVFFDGEVYAGEEGVEKVSKFPTREEAVANILGALLGPGRTLAGALKGPGGTIGGILKTIEEKGEEGASAAASAA